MIIVGTKCPFCGKEGQMMVDAEKHHRWKAGELVQNVWPEMTPDEREQLITGICGKCWDTTMATEMGNESDEIL